MGKRVVGVQRLALVLVLLATAACTSIFRMHGYAPSDAELALIEVGTDTRDTVAAIIGRPTSAGLLTGSAWYYVQSRYEQRGGYAPAEIDRQVVAVSFAEDETVANIERFGLTDGQVVALSRRVTESNIKGISILTQLLGNVGRVSAAQVTE